MGDNIQNKTLSLQHCPTEEMLTDYFTKPLQGSIFIHLQNNIMGPEFDDGNPQTHRSVLHNIGSKTTRFSGDRTGPE